MNEQDYLVLSILLTNVDERINTFREVEDMERDFISADEIENSLFKLQDSRLVTASMVSSLNEPLPESDMIELTPRGLGFCLAQEAKVMSAALGGTTSHIQEVREAYANLRDEHGLRFDSTAWTGLTKKLGAEKIAQIRSSANVLVQIVQQSQLQGVDRDNALACAKAVEILVQAPDPLWEQVISLLVSNPLTAFLNAATIIGLILGIVN